MIKYKEKAVKGIYWMGLSGVANIFFNLVFVMILSRLLNTYDFGVFAAILIVISFAEIFWAMGVGPAIVQKKDLTDDDVITGNILNIVFGISICGIIFVFAPVLAIFFGIDSVPMLRTLSTIFIMHSISGVSESLLQREMDFKSISLINSVALAFYGVSACLMAFIGYGAWALIIAYLIQAAVKTALTLFKRPVRLSFKINKKSAKELLFFGTGFTLSKLFNNIANQGDYIVVSRTLGTSFLGFYNRAYQLLMVPTRLIGTVMDKVLFPYFAKFQDNNEKLATVYLNLTTLTALIAFPITIISFIMGAELVRVILGDNWDMTVVPFKILILGLFFRMAYKICDSIIKSVGAVYKRLWIQVIYATAVIAGAYMGKDWGINGVAVGTTAAIILNYILMTLLTVSLIKVKIKSLIKYILPIIMLGIAVGAVGYLVSLSMAGISASLARLAIMTLVVGLVYLIAFNCIIKRLLPPDFNDFLTAIVETTFSEIITKK